MARRQRDQQRKLQEKRNDIRRAIGAKVVCVCAFGLWRSSSRCDSLVVVAEEKHQKWARWWSPEKTHRRISFSTSPTHFFLSGFSFHITTDILKKDLLLSNVEWSEFIKFLASHDVLRKIESNSISRPTCLWWAFNDFKTEKESRSDDNDDDDVIASWVSCWRVKAFDRYFG